MARKVKLNSNAEVVPMELVSIEDINEIIPMTNWDKILKYALTFKAKGFNVEFRLKTMETLRAKDWNKKFYLSEKGDVRFSRENDLMAIYQILLAKKIPEVVKGTEANDLDIDDFMNKEFECVYIQATENNDAFIDWVATFKANGVPVPTAEELNAGKPTPSAAPVNRPQPPVNALP